MSKSQDYIPHGDEAFNVWSRFLIQYVAAKCAGNKTTVPKWKHIPPEALETLDAAYTAWSAAYARCLEPHGKPVTVAKNESKKAAVKIFRLFVAQYLMFPPVTDEDRTAMGLRKKETQSTPVAEPSDAPIFMVKPVAACVLSIDFRALGSTGRAKPYGYQGALICYAISDKVPSGPEELGMPKLATKTPYKIEFHESERGRRVYIALCWINYKGERGPWSMIQMAVVP